MTRRRPSQEPLPGLDPAPVRPVARVRRGVDAQLSAQRSMGQLETVDAGLVALARTLADSIDAETVDQDGSRFTVGALSGRLLPVLLELRGERHDTGDGFDVELATLVAAIRDTPRPGTPDAG
jgi:hypothetical protein